MICKTTYTWRQAQSQLLADKRILKHYLIGGWTLKQLASKTNKHSRTVQERLHRILKQDPPNIELNSATVLVIDATWNHQRWCLIIYRDVLGQVVHSQFAEGERYEVIKQDLQYLKSKGYQPSAIVSDGRASIIKAAKEVYPTIPLQRCLFHIVHQAKKWLTRNPKTPAAQTLRALVISIMSVDSVEKARAWNDAFDLWQELFIQQVQERSYASHPKTQGKKWWYTHRNLRRSWRLLKNAQANLWTFLDHADMPRTTNSLEGGINAPLKEMIRRHRGWSLHSQQQAIKWWFYFRNHSD